MHAGPAAPLRATWISSGVSSASAAWRASTSARPGASPQPTARVVPDPRAAESSASRDPISSSESTTVAAGTPLRTARRAQSIAGVPGTAIATASTAAGRPSPPGPGQGRGSARGPKASVSSRVRSSWRLVTRSRSRPGVSSSCRAARTATSPVPTRSTAVTGSPVPRARASPPTSTEGCPSRAGAPRHRRRPPSPRPGVHVGSSSCVGLGGIEPPTSPLSGVRSNRLSYSPAGRKIVASAARGASRSKTAWASLLP